MSRVQTMPSYPGFLDLHVLGELRELERSPEDDFLHGLLEAFTADARLGLERMQACASAGDTASLAREAHRLKGCSGSLGALRFSRACREIERGARRAGAAGLAKRIAHAGRVLDVTQERIREVERAGGICARLPTRLRAPGNA